MKTLYAVAKLCVITGNGYADEPFEKCRKQYLAIEKLERQLKVPNSGATAARLKQKKRDIKAWMRENCPYRTRDYLLD